MPPEEEEKEEENEEHEEDSNGVYKSKQINSGAAETRQHLPGAQLTIEIPHKSNKVHEFGWGTILIKVSPKPLYRVSLLMLVMLMLVMVMRVETSSHSV